MKARKRGVAGNWHQPIRVTGMRIVAWHAVAVGAPKGVQRSLLRKLKMRSFSA